MCSHEFSERKLSILFIVHVPCFLKSIKEHKKAQEKNFDREKEISFNKSEIYDTIIVDWKNFLQEQVSVFLWWGGGKHH